MVVEITIVVRFLVRKQYRGKKFVEEENITRTAEYVYVCWGTPPIV